MLKSVFTKPKLCKAKSGWYVHFRFSNRQKRYKLGINLIEDVKEREQKFKSLAKVLHQKLKNGWNPFDDISPEDDEFRFVDALEFAIKKKKGVIAPKTFSDYSGTIRFVKSAISNLCLDYLTVKKVKRKHIRKIIEKVKDQRKWSNKSYNKNLGYLSAVMDELINWDLIEINPCTKIRRLPTQESTANRTATDAEHKKITSYLKNNNFNFYVFVMSIYYTGIRPKELLDIKISDIDFENSEIILRSNTTKNKKSRVVPINSDLMAHFLKIGAKTENINFYLFGAFDYNHKHRSKLGLDFLKAPNKIKRDTATKLWNKLIKVGLKIDVNLYSMKHKGSNDMLKAGIDLDTIRYIFGHSTKRTTTIYAKEINNVYKKELMEKFPKFD